MFHIVLFKPEKPQNVGNIMRTTVAIGGKLHLIGPLTFPLNDDSLKRSGLDYVDQLVWQYYESYEQFDVLNFHPELHILTRYGHQLYTKLNTENTLSDYYIMFGSESSGVDGAIMKAHQARLYRIPMVPTARSLNLANTVALVMYEYLRQQKFASLATEEVLKSPQFLNQKLKG
jgi:tRNA (cytidine/uridine-2'-O-)-methyltransferase